MSAEDRTAEALALARQGRLDEAVAVLVDLLATEPGHKAGWSMLAAAHQRLGRPEAALACHDQVLALEPADTDAHLAKGAVLARLGRAADALASFDLAIATAPASAPALAMAHNNRAQMLNTLQRSVEGLAAADRALDLAPGLTHAWRHRSAALAALDRLDEAEASLRTALEQAAPAERVDVLSDMGQVLMSRGRYDAAIDVLTQARDLQPDAATPRFRMAEALLLGGDFAAGWDHYDARWRMAPFLREHEAVIGRDLVARLTLAPRRSDLAGRRVLVVGEQGIGDQVMFASLLPDLAGIAAETAVVVDPRLVALLARSMPQVRVIARGTHHPDLAGFDIVVAMGSLAGVFRRTRENFSGQPFLHPDPETVARWRERLGPRRTRLRIGLSWRGGLQRTRAVARSIPLADLRPLIDRPDVEFVSLQYGDVAAEIAAANAALTRPILSFPRDQIDDFDDLAGLVAALDGVVTVQTSLAHLTGALGAWGRVMIPRRPEWRYGTGGPDMAWYGALRLLRQADDHGWGPVVAEAALALDALAAA